MAIIKFSNGQQVNFNGNPTPEDIEEVANKLGINKPPQKKSMLEKLSVIGKPFEKASDFLFGTTGKTVGSLFTGALGNAQQLVGQATKNEDLYKKGENLANRANEVIKPTNIAFTGLELYPGGGALTKALKKLPGGTGTIDYMGKVLTRIPEAIKGSAVQSITKVLNPTTKATKALAEKVAPELAERKVLSFSNKGLLGKATAELKKTGDAFDEVLSTIDGGKEFKVAPLKETLDNIKSNAFVKDRTGKIKIGVSGKPIAINNNVIKNIDELQGVLDEFGDNISFDSMRSIKQILDKEVSQSGGFLKTLKEGAELDIKKNLSNSIRNILAKESPDLAKLNAEYTLWKRTQDLMKSNIERQAGKGMSLGKKATGLAGATLGGLKWAILAPALEKAFTSTAWRTTSSALKGKLADALTSGNNKIIFEVLKRLGIGIKNINE